MHVHEFGDRCLLMSDDGMRDIWLFEICDLVRGKLNGQSADGIFQMRDLGAPMIGAVTGFFCNNQASAT